MMYHKLSFLNYETFYHVFDNSLRKINYHAVQNNKKKVKYFEIMSLSKTNKSNKNEKCNNFLILQFLCIHLLKSKT